MCDSTTGISRISFAFANTHTIGMYGSALILIFSNTSIYDPAWCYFPIGMCIGWMNYANFNVTVRAMSAFILIILWCVRYAVQFPWTGWFSGIEHEDWRYIEMAKRTGSNTILYWIVSLTSLHITPTLLVFAGMTPLVEVLTKEATAENTGGCENACVVHGGKRNR